MYNNIDNSEGINHNELRYGVWNLLYFIDGMENMNRYQFAKTNIHGFKQYILILVKELAA